ncbi:mammalian cell entry protein [Mycolicibacterium iranicum]|uniref:Mammalian cell entry protein n=1 Tax=Mycolicibacterium iranicum TaxID=912594 RepID=A0A1X1X1U9_MYCIR|nr:mammalian cell entry protein [Mycolicibacterium iranicum]ORV92854.1 mammalian cell entry protein [Mycolicibacterium iranicum]
MEDQQPGSGDLTTEEHSAAERPRRRFFGRRSKREASAPTTEAVEATVDETAKSADDAPKTPMGKAARAKAQPAQPEAGAEAPEGPVEETVEESAESPDESAEEPAEETVDETVEEAPQEPVVMVPHRPAGKGLIAAAAVASVVFVGASAFAGAMVQPYLAERALVATKLDIARAATEAITTLWTYTPDDMNTLADRATVFLVGDFADEYRRYIDAIVEANKQAQVTNTTQVMGAAVESVSPPSVPTEATALVYTNSVATSPVTKNIPALRYLSYRLTMQRDGGDWRITRMSTITSFDLTPQL